MNHDAKFHKCGIDCSTSAAYDIDICFPNRLDDADVRLSDSISSDFCFGYRQSNPEREKANRRSVEPESSAKFPKKPMALSERAPQSKAILPTGVLLAARALDG
jgi:hypothetical protein